MKLKKKTAMMISLAVGTLMFATTALAEVADKNGYEQAKEAMKYTADGLTEKLKNYTSETSFVVKDNERLVHSEESVNKYDLTKNSCLNVGTRVDGSKREESLYYRDKEGYINYSSNNGIYHVTEQRNDEEKFWQKNPFKEKEAADLEKIADALVGNLKDAVVVSQNSDGSKELSGTLNEAQIPTLINAVVSFQFKRQFSYYGNNTDDEGNMPRITQDIFVKEIKGKMLVDKNGLIQSVFGTGILYGKDEQGREHNLSFELLTKITNVNSTVVSKPDLTGKKVEKSVIENNKEQTTNPEVYTGTYRSNIIIMKDNKFQKIGERFVEVEKIDRESISGRYYEKFEKGYEEYAASAKDFKFNGRFNQYPHNAEFEYSSKEGKAVKGSISLNTRLAKMFFYVNNSQNGSIIFDDEFTMVFN